MSETNIFKVLADSQRRDILVMLREGRLNAGEISEKLKITPAALSYHLKLLKNADLISEYAKEIGSRGNKQEQCIFIFWKSKYKIIADLILTLKLLY